MKCCLPANFVRVHVGAGFEQSAHNVRVPVCHISLWEFLLVFAR